MRTLYDNPFLGKHVRKLHWTVLDLSHCEEEDWEDPEMAREVEGHRKRGEVSDLPNDAFAYGEYYYALDIAAHNLKADMLWRTFKTFVNVKSIDICWLW